MSFWPDRTTRTRQWAAAVLTLIGIGVFFGGYWGYYRYYGSRIPPEQPIPFSHRLHAGKKHISCLVCHDGADSQARSGVPEVETCMLCHTRIIVEYPPIQDLREHYYQDKPVNWVRVNELPDFVYFNHAVHLQRSVDCSHCHGDVKNMDRIGQARKFEMGWCVRCHKTYNVTHDCFSCHR